MKRDPYVCEWFACTPEGDRLTTLQRGYLMTFREKVLWSEQAAGMFRADSSKQVAVPAQGHEISE